MNQEQFYEETGLEKVPVYLSLIHISVCDRRRLFDLRQAINDLRMHGQSRDPEILRRPQGLHPIIYIFRYFLCTY